MTEKKNAVSSVDDTAFIITKLNKAMEKMQENDYPSLAMCMQRLDFKFAALFLWIILVFANLSNIF